MATFPRPQFNISQVITRPADTTAYASGDLVANNVTAGSVTPFQIAAARAAGYKGIIQRVLLFKSQNQLALADFRAHFFKDLPPTVTNGDNGAFAVATNQDKWIGSVDLPFTTTPPIVLVAGGNRLIAGLSIEIPFDTSLSPNLFALLEARSAYVPASGETFQIGLDIDQF